MTTNVEIIRGGRVKSGDTIPSLRVKLTEGGQPFNLSDYSVLIKMKRTDEDTLTVDESAVIEKADRGIVTYDWDVGETDNAGTYMLEFVANNDNSGESITFPNNQYETLYIEERLS